MKINAYNDKDLIYISLGNLDCSIEKMCIRDRDKRGYKTACSISCKCRADRGDSNAKPRQKDST